MTIEGHKPKDLTPTLVVALGILVLSQFAFSINTRKKIGERDGWACQAPGCEKKFHDGWMVDAAHSPKHHDPHDPIYDTPDAGDIRCLGHHKSQHKKGTTLGRREDKSALVLLNTRDERTWAWRAEHG